MATTVITTLTDDLDGSKAEKTVSFSYQGKQYEIDLSKKNAAALEKELVPYLAAARPIKAQRAKANKPSVDLDAVRAWARKNGYTVADRGRVPFAVLETYQAQR